MQPSKRRQAPIQQARIAISGICAPSGMTLNRLQAVSLPEAAFTLSFA
jgi:hypothetical protein